MNSFAKVLIGQLLAVGFLSTAVHAEERPWVSDLETDSEVIIHNPTSDGPLLDGKVYQIINNASGRCLDVYEHPLKAFGRLVQWDCTGENHQKFVAHQDTSGLVYTFSPLRSPEFAVATGSGSNDNGALLVQRKVDNLDSSIILDATNVDAYQLRFGINGKCLDVDSTSTNNGQKVQQWDCHGGANQLWHFRQVSVADQTKTYNLKSKFSNLCLDVTDHSLDNNAKLQQYGCWIEDNQAFTLVQGEGENVFIRGVESGKAVVVAGDSLHNGADVIQFRVRPKVIPSSVQYLVPVAGKLNTYEVRFAHSDFCLTVPFNSKNEGTRMQQYSCGRGASQEWELIERK